MKKQAGFTLIELVMVIVILGILAAVALPKFVNLGKDARAAAMKSVEGSMRSANSIIYAKAAVGNLMGGTTGTPVNVPVDGVASPGVATAYGFATSSTTLALAMDLSGDFGNSANVVSHSGAATPATCAVTYAPATSSTVPPTYTTVVTGC